MSDNADRTLEVTRAIDWPADPPGGTSADVTRASTAPPGTDERSWSVGALRPDDRLRQAHSTGLPADLQAESARRLCAVAVLYAFVFFVSNPVTAIFFADERRIFLSSPLRWGPSLLSISMALLVAALAWTKRVRVASVLKMGLLFEVVGSFGIAAAQYLDVSRYGVSPPWAGLSWVAVWMLGFTVMVPSPPRLALSAAVASASAVPLVVGFAILTDGAPAPIGPLYFFLRVVLPYLLVVVVAYVGARVVHSLGTQLKRARELGSYRLVDRLGHGGMGEVWRAEHRLLVRPAAIKLMRLEALGASGLGRQSELHERFAREAQATSSLRSPHTIELYDFGVADDGRFYYVMELLDGFDLQVLIQRFGPVPPERAAHLMKGVCHSLAEAHARGLIHRDIKPANVYVCRYGRDLDFVKVLDFGLVKPEYDAGVTQLDITAEHAARGTPAFMSPEQIAGNRPIDGRSDLYALGCVAYWLVTGRFVFAGRTAMDTLLQHVQAQPVPPSERTRSHVPRAFDELIIACLAKDPADRPDTADTVAERLEAIEWTQPWTRERAGDWWGRHHPAAPQGSHG